MANGNLAKQVSLIADIASRSDTAGADACRAKLVLEQGIGDPTKSVAVILSDIDHNIGYLAGYLPPDLGNLALIVFNVEHPVFGRRMPTDHVEALEIGAKLGKEFAKKQQAIAEAERSSEFAAKHGVAKPVSEEPISSANAKAYLEALRAEKTAKMAQKLADLEADEDAQAMKAKLKAMVGSMPSTKPQNVLAAEIDQAAREAIAKNIKDLMAQQAKAPKQGNPALGAPGDEDW